jgi:hypothetical protein
MKIAITHAHEGFTRTIGVKVDADAGKQLVRVVTTYQGFTLGDEFFNEPQSTYSRSFTRNEGISPNQPHTTRVSATHVDGTHDAGSDTWND